jgi:Protein of unknown function (DUF3326)
MIIENRVFTIPNRRSSTWLEAMADLMGRSLPADAHPLRFAIVAVTGQEATIEVTLVRCPDDDPFAGRLREIELLRPRPKSHQAMPFCAVQIIPTGVRCEFGGFAGDACPVTNLLAATVDVLLTHPNAVNASELNEMAGNVQYVEGRSLDDFLLGHIGLRPVASNRVGTFVDPTGLHLLDDVLRTLDAGRATGGLACDTYALLSDEAGVEVAWSPSGCAVGLIRRPEVIVEAAAALLADGADAIGGVSVIHGVTAEMAARHQRGEIPNPSGGVEAIITHLISKLFRVPTAHAPLPYYNELKSKAADDPRLAAELISTPHYFSVLKGLSRAPRLVALPALDADLLTLNNVGAVVMPASCLGGLPAMAAEFSDIPVIAVRENRTVLNVTNEHMHFGNVIEVESYLEAAGVLLALRHGISLPSLRRPIGGARRVDPALPSTTGARDPGDQLASGVVGISGT